MSSAVYFKFKASLKTYTIPFDGSSISVKDLRGAIRLACGLKSTDFELQIVDKQGKEYPKEDDLIPKFSDLIVRRLPRANDPPKRKIANPEDMTRRDPYKAINSLRNINPYSNAMNLAKANIPDDEKLDIMTKRCSEDYSEKNYTVKPKPYGVPPTSYVCNKCHQGGHWIHECPGLRDREGRLLDFKSVKRPTGIPQDFLLEVSPGTPGAYLTKEGKYMVPIKDAEAYAMGKKEKRPFSIEENPPYIVKDQELPSKLQCPICLTLLDNPTSTPCCSAVFCTKCISDYLYDPEVNGSRKCPSCSAVIEHHESLIENELLRQLVQCWKANMLTKEIVDSCLNTLNDNQQHPSSNKKTELNEDSNKSPEMKFNSASEEVDNGNVAIKTESEKVFINNRRVLKPKNSKSQEKKDISPNENTSVSSPCDTIENSSRNTKIESDIKIPIFEKDQDVNDLIFDKVHDLDIKKDTGDNGRNDTTLKIEIIGKRSDTGSKSSDRKIQRTFNSINPVLDSNKQLLNHFPSPTHSVQQHILNNTIPLNTIEPLQWPIVNPLFSNIPLQTMFGAALNVNANWLGNGLNIQAAHQINTNTRILTKEEFYERQRKLRAEKYSRDINLKERKRNTSRGKHRHRGDSSRSPSGSQSPKRSHKSKYNDDYNYHRHNHRKDTTRHHKLKSSDNNKRDGSKDGVSPINSKSTKRNNVSTSKDRGSYKLDNTANSSDLKTIDPKLMQDSIKTFLKYLTATSEDKGDPIDEDLKVTESSSQSKNEKTSTSNENIAQSNQVIRTSRSRSVPKDSKSHKLDPTNTDIKELKSSKKSNEEKSHRHHKKKEYLVMDIEERAYHKDTMEAEMIKDIKKSKKSKRRHKDDEALDPAESKKKKNKKSKHKKVKKIKKKSKETQ